MRELHFVGLGNSLACTDHSAEHGQMFACLDTHPATLLSTGFAVKVGLTLSEAAVISRRNRSLELCAT